MNKKILMYCFFLFTVFYLFSITLAVDLCSWRGYANISNTLVNTTDYITVTDATSSSATILATGYYTADVEKGSGPNITLNICGVSVAQGEQVFTCPDTTLNILNISITALSNSASCTYSCACSGGYCCSGASEYTDGSGSGTCQASACSAAVATTTTPGGGGGGGGGGGAVTTTTPATTTTTPVTEETETVSSINAGKTGTFTYEESSSLGIQEIGVKVKSAVSDVQIKIEQTTKPAEADEAIGAEGKVYKYLEITKTNIGDADINKVTIKFKVPKSWVTSNSIDPDTIALNRYADGKWNKLPTTKLSEDASYYYFEAESPGLSVFAITGEISAEATTTPAVTTIPAVTTKPKKKLGLGIELSTMQILGVIVGIVVILALVVFMFVRFQSVKMAT